MLLSAEHLSINFGSRQLLDDVNFYLNEGDKVGVIGINGTGKSTFLKVLSGVTEPDGGTISRNPNVQVSLLPQNPAMEESATVLEQVFLHFPAEFRELTGAMRTASIRSALLSALFMPLVMALGSISTALALSRGGSLVFAWMSMTGNENPFYEHFDEICEICAEHDVTISLGDACRPGCLADATDVCQIEELVRLGELTKRAWAHNVQVMVEGPGHVPLNQVAANMEVQKSICMGAPFYVLGPLVTDIAPGYDHITAAIGGAVAAASGAAFLCYVTPAEHLALPNVEDVKQGIVASKIAAHAADIAKGIPHARDIDDKMGDARRVLDWDAQFACALDPETAKAIRDARLPEDDHSDTCSMCGKFCAVRSMNKALAGEYIDIL